MSTPAMTTAPPDPDPIDPLVPAPRATWVRLVIGAAIVGVVGSLAYLWGFGYLVPQPDCCGDGSGSSLMSLSPDAHAVTITASFYNSSGRDLTVHSATADLPGADVLDITLLDADNTTYPTDNVDRLPAVVPAHELSRLLITFIPTRCEDEPGPWGSVEVDLGVADSPFPSFGRTYTLPHPVVTDNQNDLSVFEPAFLDATDVPRRPLAAACALLGR